MATIPRLLEQYRKELVPELSKQFGYSSTMAVPRLRKIIINMGVGEAKENIKILDNAAEELGLITGQKPAITRAKKSVANFKIREGMPVGCKVTLRRARMYEFLDRLVSVALPRVRDFRGISDKAFDGRGNYTLGITDQLIFPEVATGKAEKILGMNITIVTTANTDSESRALLKGLGMPFQHA
jgi:large subunit ribosomal protein L5